MTDRRPFEIGPVEHGLALLVAMGLADLAAAVVQFNMATGPSASRSEVAWAVSDAIPLAVALALIARRPRSRGHIVLLAVAASLLVEGVATGSSAAYAALETGSTRGLMPLLADAFERGYGTWGGFVLGAAGRALGVFYGARARGQVLEGLAIGLPLALAWGAYSGMQLAALGGPGAVAASEGVLGVLALFVLVLAVSLPLLERAVRWAFQRLGISEAPEPS